MRVLHLNSCFGKGGAASIVEDLHKGLLESPNYESTVLVADCYKQHNDKKIIVLNSLLNRYLNILIARMSGLDSIYYPFFNKKKLVQLIAESDIIHIHNLHGYYFELKNLELLNDKPVVWTIHDYWPITGRCAYFRKCNKWLDGCGHCQHKDYYPKILFFDFSKYLLANKIRIICKLKNLNIVTVSKESQNVVRNSYLKNHPIYTIYNCINLTLSSKHQVNSSFNILYCVNLSPLKGFVDFVEIINLLQPKKKYVIHTFGDKIPKNYLKKLLSNGARIIEYGYIHDRKIMSSLYAKSDVFITTSYDETFGLTTIEALSQGTNVIAYDLPVMKEILSNNGFLVRLGDTNLFAKMIQEFFELKLAKSKKDLINYSNIFSKENMINQYIALYNKIFYK